MSKRVWLTLFFILVTATSVTVPVLSPSVQSLLCSIETLIVNPDSMDMTPSPCFGLDRLGTDNSVPEVTRTYVTSSGV